MEEFLIKIGLSPSEAKIYLALIKHGEMKIGQILERAKINSGRIYDMLTSLKNKGFVSEISRNGVKYFQPAPPSVLEEYMEDKENEVKMQIDSVKNNLPGLQKLYASREQDASVEVYVGKKGAKTAYEILLGNAKEGDEYLVIGISTQEKYVPWLPVFLKTHIYPMRIRKKLKVRKLMNLEAKDEKLWRQDKSQIRYLPWNILTSYEIVGDVVVIQIIQGETIHLVIRNKQTAKDYKEQFELLWKMAKK